MLIKITSAQGLATYRQQRQRRDPTQALHINAARRVQSQSSFARNVSQSAAVENVEQDL